MPEGRKAPKRDAGAAPPRRRGKPAEIAPANAPETPPQQVPSQAKKTTPDPGTSAAGRGAAAPEKKLKKAPPVPEAGQTAAEAEKADADREEGSAFAVVGVGASAGGLEASTDLLHSLPVNTGMAYIFVHHLAPEHESLLVEILQRATRMPVAFATDGVRVAADHVYVSPPNAYLALFHGTLNLMRQEPGPPGRNAIDYFFRSLAEDQRSRAIGIVLSGTGSDGALGVRAIKAEDGIAIAQEPATAAYDGMPRSAIETGSIDLVLPPRLIAGELVRIAHHPFVRPAEQAADEEGPPADERELLERLFLVLRSHSGVDFTFYKPTTVRRRIGRRMVLHHIEELADYVKVLQDDPDEVAGLQQDLLINVTGFFREPESFEALKKEVFPGLMEGRGQFDPIRVWVPACSTGEEAFSIAMVLTEFLESQKVRPPIQIFATDVSDTSIEKARIGIYPENISSEVPPDRLHRFFTATENGYQISKSIRDTCIFAKHDITRDPPFSRLDVISCRNLLIYLGNVLQRRLIPVLHYALNPTGFLFLGTSESVGEYGSLFTLVDQKYKIYAKKPVATRPPIEFGFRQYPAGEVSERAAPAPMQELGSSLSVQREADRVAMERFVPPGVLVDENMRILQFRGDTTPFLRHAAGTASLNLLEMAREGLTAALKTWAAKASEQTTTARMQSIHVGQNGSTRTIDLEIVPLARMGEHRNYLLFFREPAAVENKAGPPGKGKRAAGDAEEVEQLRRETALLREQLRMTNEERDASTEGLRAANEEIQSSNEELQSINEELETAKEELQSTNEELTTLNEELQNRNFELVSTNDDLRNVLASVNIPILILGRDLRIRRYTPMAERALSLIPSDIGRPITDLKMKIEVPDLEAVVGDVITNLSTVERDVRDASGQRYRMQVRPYRTGEDRIDGAVISFLETTPQKSSPGGGHDHAASAEAAKSVAVAILREARTPMAILGPDLRIERANHSFATTFDAEEGQLDGRPILEIGRGALDKPGFHALLDKAKGGTGAKRELEVKLPAFPGGRVVASVRGVDGTGEPPLLVVSLLTEP